MIANAWSQGRQSFIYLQLSQGIVTLLLPWSLLCAQSDQLVDAVSHSSGIEKRNKHHTPVHESVRETGFYSVRIAFEMWELFLLVSVC